MKFVYKCFVTDIYYIVYLVNGVIYALTSAAGAAALALADFFS